jgi:hypothetical protein
MDAKNERLIFDVLDRVLEDVRGRAVMSRSEVIDLLLDLRTAVDDIARVDCLGFAVAPSGRRPRFLRTHHRHQSVPTGDTGAHSSPAGS